MERLNLNVPPEARVTLRRLAKLAKLREAEMARELLLRAIDRAEREEFFRDMRENMTPEARTRLRAINAAMEKLRGAR
jgi:hypothetical protein